MTYVFKKERKYLYKNLRIIAIGAFASILVLLVHDKPTYPLVIFIGVYFYFWSLLEIRKYKYASFITVDYNKIEEGKFSTSWDEVSSVQFTTNKGGPYIEIWVNGKRHILLPEEYDHPFKLRELIENICQQKGIIHKIDDRASYRHEDEVITDIAVKTHISQWNAILGIVVAMGLPFVVFLLFVLLAILLI